MKDQMELLLELDEAYAKIKSDILSSGDYSYEDYDIQGSRIIPKMYVTNCHDLMDMSKEMGLLSNDAFKRSLVLKQEDGKITIYSSGERVIIRANEKNIMTFSINGYMISGMKKVILIKMIMQSSDLLDATDSNGWTMYKIEYNSRLYSVGFMSDGQKTVCFMKDFVEYSWIPTAVDYYKGLREIKARGKTQTHDASDMNDLTYLYKMYNDAITKMEAGESEAEYWISVIKNSDPITGSFRDT